MKKILLNTLLAVLLFGGSAAPNSVAAQSKGADTQKQENVPMDASVTKQDNKTTENSHEKGDKKGDQTTVAIKGQTNATTNHPPRLTSTENKYLLCVEIIIHKDTTIVFSDIPEVRSANVYIYGDNGENNGPVNKADFFLTMKKINLENRPGITPFITEDKRAAISIKYDSILATETYTFLTIVKKGEVWQQGKQIMMGIKKGEPIQATTLNLNTQLSGTAKGNNQADAESYIEEYEVDTNQDDPYSFTLVLEIIFILLVLLALAASVFCFLKMKGLHKEMEELRTSMCQQIQQASNLSGSTGMNDNHIGEIARREANNAVQTLRNELNQAMHSAACQQQSSQPSFTQPLPQQPQQPQPADVDTTDVEYNANENTFVLKPTRIHHIRIFSQGGRYYFCLSDNVIGNELASQVWIGSIKTYERCIQYTMKNLNSTRIKVVENGELRKDGDRFVVAKKMVIELL